VDQVVLVVTAGNELLAMVVIEMIGVNFDLIKVDIPDRGFDQRGQSIIERRLVELFLGPARIRQRTGLSQLTDIAIMLELIRPFENWAEAKTDRENQIGGKDEYEDKALAVRANY
jgi:hypothetical protein